MYDAYKLTYQEGADYFEIEHKTTWGRAYGVRGALESRGLGCTRPLSLGLHLLLLSQVPPGSSQLYTVSFHGGGGAQGGWISDLGA